MESDIHELEPILSELELQRLILIIEKLYNKNYIINRYNIYNIFKLITLKSTIYENKYFHQYKRLYALRNIITKSSLLILKNNFKKMNFKQWNINTKISNNNSPSKNNENNYYMSVNFIGKNMKDLLIACSGLNYSSKASGRSTKLTIFDYWDYSYLPELNFISQVKEITDEFNKMKGELILNFSECLIVHISDLNSPTIDYILERVNKINRVQYIPMILFLSDNFDDKDKNFINLKKKVYKGIIERYNNLDKRMIFFEKFENDVHNEEKMKKIKNILLRFCSYYNELGDRFSLGQGDKEIFYDLTEDNFPFTINIGCIGRFGKGKSTGVNFLLGEKKAKENKSGTSVTFKINL
jgi:hypothetical protein